MLVEQQWPDVPVISKSAAPDQIVTAIACLLEMRLSWRDGF
jgi:hypothetical protein